MGAFYCPVSGCTPDIIHSLANMRCERQFSLGINIVRAFIELQDAHEYDSQVDLSLIGAVHPSGQPFAIGLVDGVITHQEEYLLDDELPGPLPSEVNPEKDVHVIPKCFLREQEFVRGPQWNSDEEKWKYFIAYGSSLAVQTYTLDIMAVATNGRMTPLRLWRLAMKQGFYEEGHPVGFEGVHYGWIEEHWELKDYPPLFPGFGGMDWEAKINKRQRVDVLRQLFVHKGKFWIWMAPDRFPTSPAKHDPPAPTLPQPRLCEGDLSVLEKLPSEVLASIVLILPLESLVKLASTSRFLRTSIFGNEYLARAWLSTSAPWWIPVPTRTGKPRERLVSPSDSDVDSDSETRRSSIPAILPYPASQCTPDGQKVEGNLDTAGLDWAYIRRCARSGSMRNRRRIWNTVLDIERVADLAGV